MGGVLLFTQTPTIDHVEATGLSSSIQKRVNSIREEKLWKRKGDSAKTAGKAAGNERCVECYKVSVSLGDSDKRVAGMALAAVVCADGARYVSATGVPTHKTQEVLTSHNVWEYQEDPRDTGGTVITYKKYRFRDIGTLMVFNPVVVQSSPGPRTSSGFLVTKEALSYEKEDTP